MIRCYPLYRNSPVPLLPLVPSSESSAVGLSCLQLNWERLGQNPIPILRCHAPKSCGRAFSTSKSALLFFGAIYVLRISDFFPVRYAKRHIALRIAYLGWNYHGFAIQKSAPNTIEVRKEMFFSVKLTSKYFFRPICFKPLRR